MNHAKVAESVLNRMQKEGRVSVDLPEVNVGYGTGGYLRDFGSKVGEQWRIFQPDGDVGGWVRADLYAQKSCKSFRFGTEREVWESLVRAYLGHKEIDHRIASWKAAYVPTPSTPKPLVEVLAQVPDFRLHLFWHRRVEFPELAYFSRPSGNWRDDRATVLETLRATDYIKACLVVDSVLKWMPLHGTRVSRKLAKPARQILSRRKSQQQKPKQKRQGSMHSLFG